MADLLPTVGAISQIGDAAAPYALISTMGRAIGQIIPDVVVEEVHRDEMTITQHPVEKGAPVSDHAFLNPATVEMRIGWSDSKHQAQGYVKTVYDALRALQATRKPFNVSTGKRRYTDMLISSIQVTTDDKSEFALNVVVGLTKVIITKTQMTAGGGPAASGGGAGTQADPAQTGSVTDGGSQQVGVVNGVPTFAQSTGIQFNAPPSPYGGLRGVTS